MGYSVSFRSPSELKIKPLEGFISNESEAFKALTFWLHQIT